MKIVLVVDGGVPSDSLNEYAQNVCQCADYAIKDAVVFFQENDNQQHFEDAYNDDDYDVYVALASKVDATFANSGDVFVAEPGVTTDGRILDFIKN